MKTSVSKNVATSDSKKKILSKRVKISATTPTVDIEEFIHSKEVYAHISKSSKQKPLTLSKAEFFSKVKNEVGLA